jgi:hypothetical protein
MTLEHATSSAANPLLYIRNLCLHKPMGPSSWTHNDRDVLRYTWEPAGRLTHCRVYCGFQRHNLSLPTAKGPNRANNLQKDSCMPAIKMLGNIIVLDNPRQSIDQSRCNLDCYVDGNVQEECLDLFNCLLEDTDERNVGRTQFFGTANKKTWKPT